MKPLLLGNDLGMNIILKKEISIQIIGVQGLKNIIFFKIIIIPKLEKLYCSRGFRKDFTRYRCECDLEKHLQF